MITLTWKTSKCLTCVTWRRKLCIIIQEVLDLGNGLTTHKKVLLVVKVAVYSMELDIKPRVIGRRVSETQAQSRLLTLASFRTSLGKNTSKLTKTVVVAHLRKVAWMQPLLKRCLNRTRSSERWLRPTSQDSLEVSFPTWITLSWLTTACIKISRQTQALSTWVRLPQCWLAATGLLIIVVKLISNQSMWLTNHLRTYDHPSISDNKVNSNYKIQLSLSRLTIVNRAKMVAQLYLHLLSGRETGATQPATTTRERWVTMHTDQRREIIIFRPLVPELLC